MRFLEKLFSKGNASLRERIPEDVTILRTGNTYLCSDRLFASVNQEAREAVERAKAASRSGSLNAAEREYVSAIELEPTWFLPYYELGVLLYRSGDPQRAAGYFHKSIALAPKWPAAYFNLAQVYKVFGRLHDSLQLAEKYISMDPSDPDGYLLIGTLYMRLGDTTKESRAYEMALELDAGCLVAHLNLGLNLRAGGNSQAAHAHFSRVIELAPAGSEIAKAARTNLATC